MSLPPTEDNYPKLHLWLRDRGISSEEFGLRIGKTRQAVDSWRLPFGHRRRMRPTDETMEAIARATDRQVLAEHFFHPTLRAANGDERGGDPGVLRNARAM